eukprot:PLAT7004.17.p1 GENE.PLAT7004.17~~PLAT7004.17.p1  ORF type:complete len:996 (-),score=480.57 PLAT7004.17:130-3096(-)
MAAFLKTWLFGEDPVEKGVQSRQRVTCLRELKAALRTLLAQAGEEGASDVITESSYDVRPVVMRLERCLRHGLKGESLWPSLLELSDLIPATELAAQTAMAEAAAARFVRTDRGKVRAWLRACLNHRALERSLRLVLSNPFLLGSYWNDHALMRCKEGSELFLSIIVALNGVCFSLDVDKAVLDHVEAEPEAPTPRVEPPRPPSAEELRRRARSGVGRTGRLPGAPEHVARRFTFESGEKSSFMSLLEDTLERAGAALDEGMERASAMLDEFKGVTRRPAFAVALEVVVTDKLLCHKAQLQPKLGIPCVVEQCIAFLEPHFGKEGMFATRVSEEELTAIMQQYERKRIIPSTADVHLVAALLVRYLRQLPRAVVPVEYYEPLSALVAIPDEEARCRNARALMNDLPWAHKPLLDKLLRLFAQLLSEELAAGNRLTLKRLAAIMGPSLLRAPSEAACRAVPPADVTMMLIQHQHDIMAGVREQLDAIRVELREKIMRLRAVHERQEPFDKHNPAHLALLERLWEGLVNNHLADEDLPFTICSEQWSKRGFQRDDPSSDFRGGGVLSLENLVYFVEHYADKALQMASQTEALMDDDAEAQFLRYPFAIAGVNITRMLTDLLLLSPAGGKRSAFSAGSLAQLPCWRLLDDPEAFPKLYCMAFMMLDKRWKEKKAHYMQFNAILADVKAQLSWVLDQAPPTIDVAWRVWLDHRQRLAEAAERAEREKAAKAAEAAARMSVPPPPPLRGPRSAATRGSGKEDEDPHAVAAAVAAGAASIDGDGAPTAAAAVAAAAAAVGEGDDDDDAALSAGDVDRPPRCIGSSQLLTAGTMRALEEALPMRFRGFDWQLLYSCGAGDGSLEALYEAATGQEATVIVVRAVDSSVFGGFASQPWTVSPSYIGDTECFVWRLDSLLRLQTFVASKKNSFYMLAGEDSLGMGGGGGFSLYLDADLYCGSSAACETFDSPALVTGEDFQVAAIELWGFTTLHPIHW